MNRGNFFAELKRRNVYKVAVAYAVVSWLLIQAASILFPTFDAPAWVMKIFVVVLVLGFVPAMIFAWAFEITPEGIKRESDIPPNESVTQHTGRKIVALTIAVAIVAAGLFAFEFFRSRLTNKGVAATTAGAIPEKSVAVLPFANLSGDPNNAYFAEGMQDEILTRLAKIGALKVISRTSTQHYASSPDNLPEIARQLGVANLLEGSVQKAGDQVHINVQLIKAASDDHLWAESYDRELQNIFGVEGEVAGAIAEALNAKLSGNEKKSLATAPTHNPAAYDAYLRGLAFEGRVDALQPNTLQSIQAFEEAVRLDPQFAEAWAHLSRQEGFMVNIVDRTAQRKEAARKALEEALKLAPDLPETQLADGFYRYWVERDYDAATKRFEALRQSYPNDHWPPYALAAICRREGKWTECRDLFAQAIALSPQDVFLLVDASLADVAMRDAAGAQKHLARAHDLSPGNGGVLTVQALSYQLSGDVAHAKEVLANVQTLGADYNLTLAIGANAILSGDYGRAISLLKAQLERPQDLGDSLGSVENVLGDLERHAGDTAGAAAMYTTARTTLVKALTSQPSDASLLSYLAWADAFLGDKDASLIHARQAIEALPASKDAWNGPGYEENLARIQAHFGDKDEAIAALQHLLTISYGDPPVTPALLRLDPDWDNLRGDPRFEKLCQQPDR